MASTNPVAENDPKVTLWAAAVSHTRVSINTIQVLFTPVTCSPRARDDDNKKAQGFD
jgi:hypothetical protein